MNLNERETALNIHGVDESELHGLAVCLSQATLKRLAGGDQRNNHESQPNN